MDVITKGWFSEVSTFWPGQSFSLEVEKVLHQEKSQFQDILMLQTKTYGKVLVLDGVIQLTERDQFSYQEMIAHVPVLSHPNPKRVMVIGGGDGAVLCQLVKYPDLEEIILCELDERVVAVSKEYFPQFSPGWTDKRVRVHHGDGLKFLQEHTHKMDVIIVDSSDPIGPAESLFGKAFFETLKQNIATGGVICTQAECVWLHLDLITKITASCRSLFKHVDYFYTTIPTYPSGQIGFMLCSDEHNGTKPARPFPAEAASSLQYYSEKVHEASFVLPEFASKALRAVK
eukprot:TRINITY_DN3355_c0_g1_i1.p1 TRINITY_DN3355_c0_g1~~TRINITY_DN3355_c0_g1_i1.p1  ORF type:complete len:308 (-),score=103.43 TRINITY_DN3355_c0_g1_i1:226-1086(-)